MVLVLVDGITPALGCASDSLTAISCVASGFRVLGD